MLTLPERTEKNRTYGLTSIHDVHLTIGQTETILKDYSIFLDYAKFGVGTAYVTPNLKEKIRLYKEFDVIPYFGGTLFEKFYADDKFDKFLLFMSNNNIETIEISTGTIDIPLEERMELVSKLCKDFNVLTEVGSKDAELIMAPSQWINEINSLLNAGANYVITEGRNSGTAGIYRTTGEMRTGLVEDIILQCDVNKIIFEAPNTSAQMHFINKIGANVNLGNIKPEDLLLLETQRVGLRSETFDVKK
jgi:phosphosulfolactate synthase